MIDMLSRLFCRFVGYDPPVHLAVESARLDCPDAQRRIFKAGGSLPADGVVQCGRFFSLDSVRAELELMAIPSELISWTPSEEPFFSDLEWAVIMGQMERLNGGRTLRGK